MSDSSLDKVTAFITRDTPRQRDVLVFEYPIDVIQIPAGTVEDGEPVEDAALREAWEETGLTNLTLLAYLGKQAQTMPPDYRVVLHRISVRQRPAPDAPEAIPTFPYYGLRRGLYVRQLGDSESGYIPISYEEYDGPAHLATAPSRCLTGWVEANAISSVITRHFFHCTLSENTPETWIHYAEEGQFPFALFWLPVIGPESAITRLIPSQASWLRDFSPLLLTETI